MKKLLSISPLTTISRRASAPCRSGRLPEKKSYRCIAHHCCKKRLETFRYINSVGIFGEIDGGHFLGVCHLRMHRERMGEEAFVHQPDTTVLCVRRETRGHTLVLFGGVFECKDEGAPSALDAAIVCGIDNTPFDSIAFFLQAFQDDAEITATLGCRRFQQAVYVFQQNVVRMVLLDDLIDGPPEDALFALDAFSTGAGNGIVLTWKTAHQKVVRRHLIDHSGDVCVHTVGIFAKKSCRSTYKPIDQLGRVPIGLPKSF